MWTLTDTRVWPRVSLVACCCGLWSAPSQGDDVFDEINEKAKVKMLEFQEQPGTCDIFFIAKDIGVCVVDVVVMDLLAVYNFFKTSNPWFGSIALLN
mmetsp:Transcript_49446/g.98199  ORF Transcript_49446/g.98199 Transcript_49446/m.98199 type:complete len:97 (+) Transcript_49446:353-643(+)